MHRIGLLDDYWSNFPQENKRTELITRQLFDTPNRFHYTTPVNNFTLKRPKLNIIVPIGTNHLKQLQTGKSRTYL